MRRLFFRAPNFKIFVRDTAGHESSRLDYADSQDALVQKFQNSAFSIERIEPYDFAEWKSRAAAETARAIAAKAAGQSYEFKDSLWGELKRYLFSIAEDRCGYCEDRILAGQPGSIEHYRPKRKVEEDKGHSGYYWLAYDETNYVPSCNNCNSNRGKMNHFPIAGIYAYSPTDDLAAEQPLLLNPFTVDPTDHLQFLEFGEIEGKTEIGRTSVHIYNLKRGDLVTQRRIAMETAATLVKFWVLDEEFKRGKELWEIFKDKAFPSASSLEALKVVSASLTKRQQEIESKKQEMESLRRMAGLPSTNN
jgi:hypothetical protein